MATQSYDYFKNRTGRTLSNIPGCHQLADTRLAPRRGSKNQIRPVWNAILRCSNRKPQSQMSSSELTSRMVKPPESLTESQERVPLCANRMNNWIAYRIFVCLAFKTCQIIWCTFFRYLPLAHHFWIRCHRVRVPKQSNKDGNTVAERMPRFFEANSSCIRLAQA